MFKGLSLAWKAVIVVVALVGAYFVWNFVDDYFSKDDEVKAEISQNQTEAAIESGKDTITTFNNQHTREVIRTETVRETERRVNEAQDTSSAHAAGADSLCVNFGICAED